jgi:hypothetical protein
MSCHKTLKGDPFPRWKTRIHNNLALDSFFFLRHQFVLILTRIAVWILSCNRKKCLGELDVWWWSLFPVVVQFLLESVWVWGWNQKKKRRIFFQPHSVLGCVNVTERGIIHTIFQKVVGGKGIVENEGADRVCLGSAEMIPKRQRRKKRHSIFFRWGRLSHDVPHHDMCIDTPPKKHMLLHPPSLPHQKTKGKKKTG